MMATQMWTKAECPYTLGMICYPPRRGEHFRNLNVSSWHRE